MSELQEKFDKAVKESKLLPTKPSDNMLLKIYSLYKQATEGDVYGDRPGGWDFKSGAKYDAWAKLQGMSQEDAMTKYVALIERLKNG